MFLSLNLCARAVGTKAPDLNSTSPNLNEGTYEVIPRGGNRLGAVYDGAKGADHPPSGDGHRRARYTGELYNEKIYDITERGFERLDFLRDTVYERMEDERLTEFLANIKRCRVLRQDGKVRVTRRR